MTEKINPTEKIKYKWLQIHDPMGLLSLFKRKRPSEDTTQTEMRLSEDTGEVKETPRHEFTEADRLNSQVTRELRQELRQLSQRAKLRDIQTKMQMLRDAELDFTEGPEPEAQGIEQVLIAAILPHLLGGKVPPSPAPQPPLNEWQWPPVSEVTPPPEQPEQTKTAADKILEGLDLSKINTLDKEEKRILLDAIRKLKK